MLANEANDAQMGGYAGVHLGLLDRFGDVIHRAGVEPPRQILHVRLGRDEDDGNVRDRFIFFEAAAGLEAVHLGHHDVQQHQVRMDGRSDAEGLGPAGGEKDLMAERCQHLAQQVEIGGLVVDQQELDLVRFSGIGHGSDSPFFAGHGGGTSGASGLAGISCTAVKAIT